MWIKITTEIGERESTLPMKEELSIKIIVWHPYGLPSILIYPKKKTKYGLHYDIYDFPV